MAGYIHNDVYDLGLNELTESTVLHILSSAPASFAEIATKTLGNKAAPSVGAPAARAGGGREVTVAAVTDGAVTGSGTASHWALVDGSRVLAYNALSAPQAVTSGNTFTLPSFTIGIPSPA